MGDSVQLALLTSPVMEPADAVLVFLLFLLPPTTPLSCMMPCEPGQESTEERPCHLCPQLDANNCQSNEIVEGVCGCQECAKAVGEECGGPWEALGQCAGSFTCIKPHEEEEWAVGMSEGICCCPVKNVGGIEYRLARLADKAVPSECLSSCIYTRESGGEFCLAPGILPVYCVDK